jgi:hypothetical protein
LTQLTRLFQTDLFYRLLAAGLTEARVPHTLVMAQLKAEGSRLTELAARARMTLPAMASSWTICSASGSSSGARTPLTDGPS